MSKKLKINKIFVDSILEHYAVLFSVFVLVACFPMIMFLVLQKDIGVKPYFPQIFAQINAQPICSYHKLSCPNDQNCDSAILTCPNATVNNQISQQDPVLPVGLLVDANCTQITGWAYNSLRPYQIVT